MLSSAFPSYLVWGPELISFYNDAYVPILGTKPDALGRPFQEVWSEVWDQIAPITARAMAGEASYFEDFPFTLVRRGSPEQTWFTVSYSPIRDESGGVGGMLCTVHETTARIVGERERERLLQELAAERGRLPWQTRSRVAGVLWCCSLCVSGPIRRRLPNIRTA